MKKFLAIILSLALALTSAVAMMIPAFADDPVDPIVYDFTEEGASEVNWSGTVGHCWDGAVSGTSAYDADEKAWKIELTESYEGSWQGCYEVIHTGGAIDFSTYKYFAVCFKENMPEGQGPLLNKDGAAHVDYLSGGKDDFTKSIFETSLLGQGNDQIIVNLSSQGDATGLTAGSAVWIKYIAFFATEEEAEAFEIVEEEPAAVDPIVYNFTEEGASEVNWSGALGHCWDGAVSGTSAYDADEKAWKMELTESYEGSWQGCYEVIHTGGAIDFSTYKYFAVCFKENMPEGQGPLLNKDGAAHVDYLSGGKDDFTKSIFETSLLGQGNDQIIVNLSSQGDSTGLTAGSAVWIKYIAFFATEEEAEAFEIVEEEPETSEPETSEPETSEPETSEPETSEPETSEPETSEPEANSDPIIFNYTVDNDPDTCYPDGGNFLYNWGSSVAGPSAYDADEQAWVMTSEVALGQYATAYEHIWNGSYSSVVDWNTYKYIVFVYKTAGGNETQHYAVMDDGAANVFELPASDDGYSKFVTSTDAFHDAEGEVGYQILTGICNYGADGSEAGVSLAIKYIAFFATEEEANAYDFGIAEPETSEPETSEPETSEPETSEPETSEPETSEPETSEPETSEPETSEPETSEPEGSEESGEESGKEGADTGDIAMVSGAILLCAAAATIAVVSRKRK